MIKILIVDDEPDVRELLGEMVAALGHEPRPAADGRAAWEAFEQEPFRLLMTDWPMPGMDGLELVRRVAERILSLQDDLRRLEGSLRV